MGLRAAEHRGDRLRRLVPAQHRRTPRNSSTSTGRSDGGGPAHRSDRQPGSRPVRLRPNDGGKRESAGHRRLPGVRDGAGSRSADRVADRGRRNGAGAADSDHPQEPAVAGRTGSTAEGDGCGLGTVLAAAQAHQRRNCGGQHDHPAAVVPVGPAGGTSGVLPCARGGEHGESGGPLGPVPAAAVLPAGRHQQRGYSLEKFSRRPARPGLAANHDRAQRRPGSGRR